MAVDPKLQACDDAAKGAAGQPCPTRGARPRGVRLSRFRLARHGTLDETRELRREARPLILSWGAEELSSADQRE